MGGTGDQPSSREEAQAAASGPSNDGVRSESIPDRPRRSAATAAGAAISRLFAPAPPGSRRGRDGLFHITRRRAPRQASSTGGRSTVRLSREGSSARGTRTESRSGRKRRGSASARVGGSREGSGAGSETGKRSRTGTEATSTASRGLRGVESDPHGPAQESSPAAGVSSAPRPLQPVHSAEPPPERSEELSAAGLPRSSSRQAQPAGPGGRVSQLGAALTGIAKALRGLENPSAPAPGSTGSKPPGCWGFFCMGWGQPPAGFSLPMAQSPGCAGVPPAYTPVDVSGGASGSPDPMVLSAEFVPGTPAGTVAVLPPAVRAAVPAPSVSVAPVPGAPVPLSLVASVPAPSIPCATMASPAACAPSRARAVSSDRPYLSLGSATLLAGTHHAAGVDAGRWNSGRTRGAPSPSTSSTRHGQRVTCDWRDRNTLPAPKLVDEELLRIV
ncbi:conserved hypothetical protein [Neospora caninum Liverpool]|uniref:Uncharacterized protein n=1 Tax=Neospora caninum (strain Liverpool) TaxID=572307 RepID=F0VJG3_NEOCL|nr:conserved hypothetical protein [Neospora caninum Liverpool]CBZ53874.1 conserved hypothetical protein [Neospora caninum Liverpool]CEL67869.1 TPA: hypothetical protein BN1204_036560 [Neospora caninum Liverpool]|eukprot:XP_003883906.1 conserved hypothetical protein [Neospora caninum Liverpool]